MGIRIAASLALMAALLAGGAARAQGWFGNYELSPRQIVGVLEDDGYELRGAMVRRGDVYVCDATSVSGRTMRLIVSARDGRVVDRFATEDRRRVADQDRDWGRARPPRDLGSDQDGAWSQPPRDSWSPPQRDQFALGDQYSQPSRVYGNDNFAPKPAPTPDSVEAPKPKRHVQKKHHDATVAKAPATESKPSPDAAEPGSPAPSPSPSMAVVQPSAPEKAMVEPVKPAPTPQAVAPTPQPSQAAAEPVKPANIEAEKAPAPKPEAPKKKLNDLPVGTLD